jgi:hypothetical protein
LGNCKAFKNIEFNLILVTEIKGKTIMAFAEERRDKLSINSKPLKYNSVEDAQL